MEPVPNSNKEQALQILSNMKELTQQLTESIENKISYEQLGEISDDMIDHVAWLKFLFEIME